MKTAGISFYESPNSMNASTPFTPKPKSMWAQIPVGQRIYYLTNEMAVPHPMLLNVINQIRRYARRCRESERGQAIYVEIPTGAGKTFITRFFMVLMPRQITDHITLTPVVAFSIPGTVTYARMSPTFLQALGDPKPFADKSAEGTPFDRAIEMHHKSGVEIVLIDNVQDVATYRREAGIREIGKWGRDFIEKSKRLVVFLGSRDSRDLLNPNPELRRRCSCRKKVDYFDVQTVEGMSRFMRFLNEIDDRIPLTMKSNLASPEIAIPFAFATGGIQDFIFKVLGEAVPKALEASREFLTLEDLAIGFDELFGDDATGCNPFRGKATRVLNHAGEPLFDFIGAKEGSPRGKT